MLIRKEENELLLLSAMPENGEPVGSLHLSLALEENGTPISSATIGRLLAGFDRRGFTVRHGYRGRTLTREGAAYREELEKRSRLSRFADRMNASVDVTGKENLLNVLTARRGIERELARLAALRATDADLEALRQTFALQSPASRSLSADYDVAFHRAIAASGKNPILAAAYDLIWQNGKYSPVMEYIRNSVGGELVVDHRTILEAIEAHDPAAAESAMVAHIDGMLADVERYWGRTPGSFPAKD